MDRVRAPPVHVPASERHLARRAIEREDPLFTVSVREVPDVEIGGLVGEHRRGTAGRGVLIVDRQDGYRHVALTSPPAVAEITSGPCWRGGNSAGRWRRIRGRGGH